MNCPKCGFAQERRSDCKKCGVVFSKYYALYPSAKPAVPKGLEDPIENELAERERSDAITELQLQVRELSARFDEMESDRAEREQFRTEMENLQRLLHESLDLTSSRLDQFEQHMGEFSAERPETGGDANAAEQLSELQSQLGELHNQVQEMQSLLDQLQQKGLTEPPQGVLEHDVHAIRENLDHLFAMLKHSDQ